MDIKIAADFFFHQWSDAARRQLWLCYQPYIVVEDGADNPLLGWINNPSSASWDVLTADISSRLTIPVPIPAAYRKIRTQPLDLSGNAVGVVTEVDRDQHCQVIDQARLFALAHDGEAPTPSDSINPGVMSYTDVMWEQLRDASASLSADDMAAWLTQTFEMGQRVRFDDDSLTHVSPHFDARQAHDLDPAATRMSNKACLLGHMAPLGGDIALLKSIRKIRLTIEGLGDFMIGDPIGNVPLPLETFFGSIDEDLGSPGPTASWDNAFSRRVYASPMGDTFVPRKLYATDEVLWRQPRGDQSKEATEYTTRWSAFERLVIRFANSQNDPQDPDREVGLPAGLQNGVHSMQVTPEVTVDVQISIYRRYPTAIATETGPRLPNRLLLQIDPAPYEAARFEHLLARHASFVREIANGDPQSRSVRLFRDPFRAESEKPDADSPSELDLAWISSFDLPWNAAGRPVLIACVDLEAAAFVPESPDGLLGNGLLRIRLPYQLRSVLQGYDDERPGHIKADDPFGPRWDYWTDTDPDIPAGLPDFDAVSVTPNLELSDGRTIDQLIVAAIEKDRRTFELAQSARRIECVQKVTFEYDDFDRSDPDLFTAGQAFSEDQVNHNALNVLERASGALPDRFHNAFGELGPVFQRTTDLAGPTSQTDYVFQLAFTEATSPEWTGDSQAFAARSFTQAHYDYFGRGRTLGLNLEHTYGSCVGLNDIAGVPNPLDEPISLLPNVGHRPETAAVPKWQMISVAVMFSDVASIELQLDTQALKPGWIDAVPSVDDSGQSFPAGRLEQFRRARAQTHARAWEAVAEVVQAAQSGDGEAVLIAECYRYRLSQALSAHDPSVRNGLVVEERLLDASETARLAADLNRLLRSDQHPADPNYRFPIPASWATDCHAIRVRLDLRRSAAMAPENVPSDQSLPYDVFQKPQRLWDNGRGGEQLFGADGLVLTPRDDEAIEDQVRAWISQLSQAGAYVRPSPDDQTRRDNLASVLGAGPDDLPISSENVESTNDAWIAPSEFARDRGSISVAYCPVGLEPLARDKYLQDATSPAIRRYFLLLQELIDMNSAVLADKESAGLLAFLDRQAGNRLPPAYAALVSAATSKAHAIPDPNTPEEHLNRHVAALATAIEDASSTVAANARRWIKDQFTTRPGLFGDAKALGVIQLGGEAFAAATRDDLLSVTIGKRIRSEDPQLESQTLGFHDRPFAGAVDGSLAFMEFLADTTYDNAFEVWTLEAETVERVLQQAEAFDGAGNLKPEIRIPLAGDGIFVPDPQIAKLCPVNSSPADCTRPQVRLASRRPVVDPTAAFVEPGPLAPSLNRRYEIKALMRGQLVEANQGQPAARAVSITSGDFPETLLHDQMVVSSLYSVAGDEEVDEALAERYANDLFYLHVDHVAPTNVNKRQSDEPHPDAMEVFDALRDTRSLTGFAEPEKAIGVQVMNYVAGAVSRSRTVENPPQPGSTFATVRILPGADPNQPGVELLGQRNAKVRVALFVSDAPAALSGDQRVFLLFESVVSIWDRHAISLQQTRNQPAVADDQRRVFSPRFMTVSGRVGETVPAAPVVFDFVGTRLEFDYRNVAADESVLELIQRTLGDVLADTSASFAGQRHRLVIAVKQDAAAAFPTAKGASQWIGQGSFAVQAIEIPPQQIDREPWLEESSQWLRGSRWRIDFEWRDVSNNDIVLRVQNVPVRASGST